MASRPRVHTYIMQNPTTFQPSNVPPVATPAVTVSLTWYIIDMPDAPPRID